MYDLEKKIVREELRVRRNKNIIKATIMLVLVLVLIFIGYKQYDDYLESQYEDKQKIIDHNLETISDFIDGLKRMNGILADRLFNINDPEFSDVNYLEGFRSRLDYDLINEVYNEGDRYITFCCYPVIDILEKDMINRNDQLFLYKVLQMNNELIETYNTLMEQLYDEESLYKEIAYLYFYDNEMDQILKNIMSVYEIELKGYRYKEKEIHYVGQPIEHSPAEESDAIIKMYDLYGFDEKWLTVDGDFMLYDGLNLEGDSVVEESEIKETGWSYVSKLNNQMTLDSMEHLGNFYVLAYNFNTEFYKDRNTQVILRINESGHLVRMVIENLELLLDDFTYEYETISLELSDLDLQGKVKEHYLEIYRYDDRNIKNFVVIFEVNRVRFRGEYDVETGALKSVEVLNEK